MRSGLILFYYVYYEIYRTFVPIISYSYRRLIGRGIPVEVDVDDVRSQ